MTAAFIHVKSTYSFYGFQLFRVKELGPESNAKKKAAPADGGQDDTSAEDVSALSDGRHLNNVDLALLCNHSVSALCKILLEMI